MQSNSRTTKYVSFDGTNDYDGPPKVGFEALASQGQVITVSTAQGFNSSHKPYSSSILQTNAGCNKQVGTGYSMTKCTPKEFDFHSHGHARYGRTSPVSNITSHNISATTGNIFAHHSDLNHQSLGEVATINSTLVAPANTAFVETTDLRSASKPSRGPAQLTIFYAGSVCVCDDVSPEKAQAIMLLARNGHSPTNPLNKTHGPPTLTNPLSKTPSPPTPATSIATRVETQTQRPNGFVSNKKVSISHTTPLHLSAISSPMPISVRIPQHATSGVSIGFAGHELLRTTPSSCTNFPSPISVSSLSSGGSTDVSPARSLASLASPTSKPEPSKAAIIQGACGSTTTTTTTTTPSAVPLARRASLARFLEKRKERAETAAPYSSPGKQLQECATPGSESRSFSIASVGSFSLSYIK